MVVVTDRWSENLETQVLELKRNQLHNYNLLNRSKKENR